MASGRVPTTMAIWKSDLSMSSLPMGLIRDSFERSVARRMFRRQGRQGHTTCADVRAGRMEVTGAATS